MRLVAAALLLALAAAPAARAGELTGPMVVSDAWPRATTPQQWASDVLRIEGKEGASDRDQALALYTWARLFVMSPSSGMEPYEGPYGQEQRLLTDITKVMFVHGCGDCDYQARALEAIWCLYKGDDRAARRTNVLDIPHTMVELAWDGAWHAFDPLNGVFFLDADQPGANVLSHAQASAREGLLVQNERFAHRARPFFERVRSWTGPGEWRDHLLFQGAFDSHADFVAAGQPPMTVFGTHSNPSTYALSDMSWHLPRGTRVERAWSASRDFYRPRIAAQALGLQGRHYRQAVEWGPARTHWNAQEDLYNFPKIEPYLAVSEDTQDALFFGRRTLFLVGSGVIRWEADLWSEAYLDAVEGASALVRHPTAPYLRPSGAGSLQSITFRVRSPYIIAEADLAATLDAGAEDLARLSLSADGGASWEEVARGAGSLEANLGKARFDGARQSAVGKYGYLVRLELKAARDPATVGLRALALTTRIDGSLNALPRLEAGANTVRFQVADASRIAAPIEVEYAWRAGDADARASRTFAADDFQSGEASWRFDAPGLTRCSSYAFSYGALDQDADGLPDSWERGYFGSTLLGGADDPDADGLANAQEFAAGSAPGTWTEPMVASNDAGVEPPPAGLATDAGIGGPRKAGGCGSGTKGCGCSSAGPLAALALAWMARVGSARPPRRGRTPPAGS